MDKNNPPEHNEEDLEFIDEEEIDEPREQFEPDEELPDVDVGDIFRLKTIEQQRNPAQLDQMLDVVTPKTWLFITGILGMFTAVVFWSIFGSIPVKLEGRGLVISSGGLFSIQSRGTGLVSNIYAPPGKMVEKGTLLAEMSDPEKEIQLASAEKTLKELEDNLKSLRAEVTRENAAIKEATDREIAAKKFAVEQMQNDIKINLSSIATKEKLVEQGLISQVELDRANEILISKRIELETTLSSIATLKSKLVQGYRTEELKNKEMQVAQALASRNVLQSSIENLKIYSYYRGKVLDWLVNIGDMIGPGTPLVWMEHIEPGFEDTQSVLGFLPIEKGKKVKVGDPVEIELTTVNTSQYGYLEGVVKQISNYADSQKNVAKLIQNDGLAAYLTGNMPVVMQVTIELKKADTPSGYQWTSGEGPDIKISTGTVSKIRTILERIRPIYYVFPIWRLKYATDHVEESQEPQAPAAEEPKATSSTP